MIVYLVKMTVCALLFYAIYVLLLENENMHRFKRIYLPGSLIFAMIVPFAAITLNIPQIPANIKVFDIQPLIVESHTWIEEMPAATPVNYFAMIVSM